MRLHVIPAVLALATGACPRPLHAASFDCAKATTADERAVCADNRLSDLDGLLGAAYAQAKRQTDKDEAAKLLSTARAIHADRRTCGAARPCLLSAYVGGLEAYAPFGSSVGVPDWVSALDMTDGPAPASRSVPVRAGQCVATAVTNVTPRLEGSPATDFSSGTAVNFANGGHQVSYSREAAVIASKPGDEVVMCLTSIPRGCPPGDDRGRSYTVTNLRTRRTWSLADSQHMCGGA